MRNKYFRSKDESSLEARFKEQQDHTTTLESDLSDITNSGQIAGFIILNQTEYDALEGTNSDNILYFVKEDTEA